MSDWRSERACKNLTREQTNDSIFGGGTQQAKASREHCAHCPVRELCLWTAMTAEAGDDTFGDSYTEARWFLFGGHTGPQRARLAERLKVTAAYARARLDELLAAYARAGAA